MHYTYKDEEKELTFEGSVKELLEKLSIQANTVIVVRNKKLLLKDAQVEDKDTIDILTAISGG